MRITIDSDRCISGGQCVLTAREVFDQDEDGFAMLRPDWRAHAGRAAVDEAAAACPVRAITVTRD